MNRRIVMLGADGLDRELLQQWADAGRLPVFREILRGSRSLLLDDANASLPGAVWTDVAKGVSAGVHGYYNEEQLRVGSYESENVYADRIAAAAKPFYAYLSDAGVRCAVVDFPVDVPIDGFNGIHVVDWATESRRWRFETRPGLLAQELVSSYGQHPLTHNGRTQCDLPGLLALKEKLLRGIEIKRRFCADLVQRREHEFVFVNFCELHKAGHFLWKFHDRRHPEFSPAEPRLVDAIRQLYEKLDHAFGSVLEQLGDDDDLIVFTDRGMHSNFRGDHLLDELLLRLELAGPRGTLTPPSRFRAMRARLFAGGRAKSSLRKFADRLLPPAARNALRPLHRAATGAPPPFDMNQTRVFRLPTVGDGYLRVNLMGREPRGTVRPGAEYDALLLDVAARLRALVNPETQQPAVRLVSFPAKQFAGPTSTHLPDIAVIWNSDAPINAVASDDVGIVSGVQRDVRSGNHGPQGLVLFRGSSAMLSRAEQDGDPRQIAPTILQHFGVTLPHHYELKPANQNGPPEVLAGPAYSKRVA
jgi:predicted AlkP superfamily phosphohydrolase/phosphomutase